MSFNRIFVGQCTERHRAVGLWQQASARALAGASALALDLGSEMLSNVMVVPREFRKSRALLSKGNDDLAVENSKNLVSIAPNHSERRRCCGLRWAFNLRKSLLESPHTLCTSKLPLKRGSWCSTSKAGSLTAKPIGATANVLCAILSG